MKRLLTDLNIGESATIVHIDQAECYVKLLEMGCVEGAHVEMIHKAILNGPVAVRIAGYTLSLRVSEARLIKIA